MKTNKQIAVWLDHSKANLIEHKNGNATLLESITSLYGLPDREDGEGSDKTKFGSAPNHSSNNENKKHNIAQNELNDYFKTLEKKLEGYDEILLFGPTNAKEKLSNRLTQNKAFSNKAITVQPSDKLTENQLLAHVREFNWNN